MELGLCTDDRAEAGPPQLIYAQQAVDLRKGKHGEEEEEEEDN